MFKNHLSIRNVIIIVLTLMVLAACSGDGSEFLGMPLTQATPVSTITPVPTVAVVTPVPEDTVPDGEDVDAMDTLLLWVPPFMDPANDSSAAELLQEKLDAFIAQNPNIEIIVRVKGETGTASLLESLTAVSAVAPLELPSLVVLRRVDLESAAKKGLILPMGDYSTVINEIDWFQYARSLSVIGDSSYGLPMAGNMLVMVVRTEPVYEEGDVIPESEDTIDQIGFWLNNPEAALVLNDYLSLGGTFVNDENQVVLSEEELVQVYTRFQADAEAGLFYGSLTEITSHADVWERYKNGEYDVAIVPSSFPLSDLQEDSVIVPLTPLTNYDHTLAKGWVIALADPLPERREVAVSLAESMTEVVFMGQWSEALGYLPVRNTAFEHWQTDVDTQQLSLISFSAHIYPSPEIIQVVSPALETGLFAVLYEGKTPEEAALRAIESLNVED
jgi:ABC-type glycerol-3-phosphate transport system substrate-binding protein